VRLFESGLLGQAQTGQAFLFDTMPKGFAKIFLQDFEFHKSEYTTVYSGSLLIMWFQHLKGNGLERCCGNPNLGFHSQNALRSAIASGYCDGHHMHLTENSS
jgi:hypothetical protein